jgi:hypothetical protein
VHNELPISVLLNKTFSSVYQNKEEHELHFICTDGTKYKFFHAQDCCESVTIESIVGDLNDLVGSPILLAEESSGETPSDYKFEYEPDSYTWTFYKFATAKGYVDIRWLGESNGYYGEEVYFAQYE